MLTRARTWEWERLPAMRLLWLLCLLAGQVLLGNGASVTWGHVHKYASVLHTEDVYLPPGSPGRDVAYGSQNGSDNYRITGVHVEDLGAQGAEAVLTAGGIGQQFVVLHCRRLRGAEEQPQAAHLEVSIYGVDL
ncbi:uncharacterized protein LOC6547809 [Drosophila erecta]|uniref:Uncharacterized protein n=1 Tax=Drosophila erecta TaxID=7220 RepID=B3NPD9_DROER|nr:uncharacterized protein LOC6547809 [Drosophila erecta]EDV56802.1 uncharacterized protein Dere_GG22852 [Drosophila erecta]